MKNKSYKITLFIVLSFLFLTACDIKKETKNESAKEKIIEKDSKKEIVNENIKETETKKEIEPITNNEDSKKSKDEVNKDEDTKPLSIGEYKGLEVELENIITLKEDKYVKANENSTYNIAEFKFTNKTGKKKTFSMIFSFFVKVDGKNIIQAPKILTTEAGKKYKPANFNLDNNNSDRGALPLELPKDYKKLEIYILDKASDSIIKFTYDNKSKKASVETKDSIIKKETKKNILISKENKDMKVSLEKVELKDGVLNFKPSKNHKYIIFTFSIENKSSKPLEFSSTFHTSAKVDNIKILFNDNSILSEDLDSLTKLNAFGLKPGESTTGLLGYEVPENFKEINIDFLNKKFETIFNFKYENKN